jgi:hypothetical protein
VGKRKVGEETVTRCWMEVTVSYGVDGIMFVEPPDLTGVELPEDKEEDGETVLGKVANVWEAAQQAKEMAGDASAASKAASKWLGLK